jgi:hypothetical protein
VCVRVCVSVCVCVATKCVLISVVSLLSCSPRQHADVRLNVIGKLDVLQQVIGVESVTSILVPEITALADDTQVRRMIVA